MREQTTTAAGGRTRFYDEGRGEAVVLLHGGSLGVAARSTWLPVFGPLSDSFRVVAFDQAGFGGTVLPDSPAFVGRTERVEHAMAFIDSLDVERVTLVGHSEGGFVSVRLAVERPEKVARLVLVTSGSVAPRLGGEADRDWMRASNEAYAYHEYADSEDALVERYWSHLASRPDPELADGVREGYREAEAQGRLQAFIDAAVEETDYDDYMAVQARYIEPHLPELEVPTLLMWARDDATVPVARGVELMARMPQADMLVLSQARHMVMWDRPEAFVRGLTGWLNATSGAAAQG